MPNFFNEISSELDLIDRINLSINFFNEVTDTVDSKLLLNSIRYDQNLFYKNIILWDDWLQINDPMLG